VGIKKWTSALEKYATMTTDGNKSTDISACLETDRGIGIWWQIYLGGTYITERIKITNIIGENEDRSK